LPLPEWADEFYSLLGAQYLPGTKEAEARTDQGLANVKKSLPKKGSRILDLCCGAGAYLFPLEKAGYEMTGLDIQEKMIGTAKRYAKKTNSRSRLVVGDATKTKFKDGTFDGVVFLGAPFGHFSMDAFSLIAKEGHRVLRKNGVFVAEVNDHVGVMISGMYQRTLYEGTGKTDVVSIHTRYDPKEGVFNRLYLDLENNRRFKGSFHIWSPWMLQHVMEEVGFRLKSSGPGSFGIFSHLQAYVKR